MKEVKIPENLKVYFEEARRELGEEEFYRRLDEKFGKPCLNFVRSLVINLPGDCFANCYYCIDKKLRKSNSITEEQFLEKVRNICREFKEIEEVAITGGTVSAKTFNKLTKILKENYPDARLTYNTHGANLNEDYLEGISKLTYVNLHRNAIDEDENLKIFRSTVPIVSLEEAKRLFKDKLYIRVTIDENFDFNSYLNLNLPLYLNRMLPGNEKTDEKFDEVLEQLNDKREDSIRRRNRYLNKEINGIPVRLAVGDGLATHIPNRYPIYLNVVILHRSGVVSGTWYEDDKVLVN